MSVFLVLYHTAKYYTEKCLPAEQLLMKIGNDTGDTTGLTEVTVRPNRILEVPTDLVTV